MRRLGDFTDYGAPSPALRVTTVYGDSFFVRQDDYTSPHIKVQVPLATRDGVRLWDRTNKRGLLIKTDPGRAYTIHRENIVKAEEVKPRKATSKPKEETP